MSVHLITFQDNKKVMRAVRTREEFSVLRDTDRQRNLTAAARNGDAQAKRQLLQFNYSCVPSEDNAFLKGSKTPSHSVGMDIDFDTAAPDYAQKMQNVPRLIYEKRKELGLLLLERSARKGYHLVFQRHTDMTQEQNLQWASSLLGVQFDQAAKDITRVFFAPADSVIYLDDAIFDNSPAPVLVCDEEVESQSVDALDGQSDESSHTAFPDDYDGIPYKHIVKALCTLLGGEPAHGSRNNFIFSMAAHLRYICNDDPQWIARVLPTYGEDKQRWRSTIASACQRAQLKQMPSIVRRAIDNARRVFRAEKSPYAFSEKSAVQPPAMPQVLPPLIEHLIKNVPEICRPSVACGVFPALAAHLKGVRFSLIDGSDKEATLMCVNIAPQSSGKSAINKPLDYILADIVARDEVNRKREQKWKEACSLKSNNRDKPKRPDDLCVQVLVSDMTNAAFTQRMADAGEHYLYCYLEEIELLQQLQTNGTKDIGKIVCLLFDNGIYGQERVGAQSVTARVRLRWNWNANTTPSKAKTFFRNRLVDGTLSRISFCTIIPDCTKPFKYGSYDADYAEVLRPYIEQLNGAQGLISCPEALDLAQSLEEECQEEVIVCDDEVLNDLSHRAITIAYLKGMVLYVANGCKWSEEIADFVRWSLHYDLYCKNLFFGDEAREAKSKERIVHHTGRKNLLELLPDRFSERDASDLRTLLDMSADARGMLQKWCSRGYVFVDPTTAEYVKTEKYFDKHPKG